MAARLRLTLGLILVLAIIAATGGVSALGDVLVGAGPLLAIGGLLLSGRYPGERVLLALVRRRGATLRAALTRTWPRGGRQTFGAALPRSSRTLRGPPRRVPAAA